MENTPWDFPTEEARPRKSNAGRPKGVLNKTPEQKLFIQQVEGVYKDIEHMLTAGQRDYYKKAFAGRAEFDPIKDGELFVRLYSMYCINITTKKLKEGVASKEVADNVNQYRQFLKDIEDMNRKREELKVKTGERGDVVDPTRESSLGRFQDIHR